MTELTAADGHKFSAYRVEPAEEPKGAVIVLQEIFGVNGHIKKIVDGFAQRGYVAIAPSLFDRARKDVALGYDEAAIAEGAQLSQLVGTTNALLDIQATVDSLKSVGKIAIIGYCWGGTLAYVARNSVNGIACVVGYYGGGIPADYRDKCKVPTLLHFGETDALIPFQEVEQFRAMRPDVSVFSYPAGHGFNCDERASYDEDSARKALERTLFWISQYVVGQEKIVLKNAGFYAAAKPDKKKKKATADNDMGPPLD